MLFSLMSNDGPFGDALTTLLGDAGKCACVKSRCIFYTLTFYLDRTINTSELSNIDFPNTVDNVQINSSTIVVVLSNLLSRLLTK